MITNIDNPIKVGVIFEHQGSVRPVWFVWKGRRYDIREVTYSWAHREGAGLVQNFAVSDGVNLFQISYYRNESAWRLTAVEDGEI